MTFAFLLFGLAAATASQAVPEEQAAPEVNRFRDKLRDYVGRLGRQEAADFTSNVFKGTKFTDWPDTHNQRLHVHAKRLNRFGRLSGAINKHPELHDGRDRIILDFLFSGRNDCTKSLTADRQTALITGTGSTPQILADSEFVQMPHFDLISEDRSTARHLLTDFFDHAHLAQLAGLVDAMSMASGRAWFTIAHHVRKLTQLLPSERTGPLTFVYLMHYAVSRHCHEKVKTDSPNMASCFYAKIMLKYLVDDRRNTPDDFFGNFSGLRQLNPDSTPMQIRDTWEAIEPLVNPFEDYDGPEMGFFRSLFYV